MGNLPECRPESSLVKKSGTTLKPPVACFEIRGSDEHPENRPTAGYSPSHVTMFEIPAISFQRQIVWGQAKAMFFGRSIHRFTHLLHENAVSYVHEGIPWTASRVWLRCWVPVASFYSPNLTNNPSCSLVTSDRRATEHLRHPRCRCQTRFPCQM